MTREREDEEKRDFLEGEEGEEGASRAARAAPAAPPAVFPFEEILSFSFPSVFPFKEISVPVPSEFRSKEVFISLSWNLACCSSQTFHLSKMLFSVPSRIASIRIPSMRSRSAAFSFARTPT